MPTTLITGANKGIGLKLVERYAKAGHHVIACCRNPDTADDLKALAEETGKVQIEGVTVGDGASVTALRERVGDQPIDLIINNAGMAGPAPDQQSAQSMDFEGWAETMNVNTMAPLRVLQAFRPNLAAAEHAKAVTITSQMGALSLNMPVMYAYCSSKAAVNKIMSMYATDAANDGIAVQLIHPGWVQTDMGGAQADITPEQSADGIISVIDGLALENTGSFMKWNGEVHDW